MSSKTISFDLPTPRGAVTVLGVVPLMDGDGKYRLVTLFRDSHAVVFRAETVLDINSDDVQLATLEQVRELKPLMALSPVFFEREAQLTLDGNTDNTFAKVKVVVASVQPETSREVPPVAPPAVRIFSPSSGRVSSAHVGHQSSAWGDLDEALEGCPLSPKR